MERARLIGANCLQIFSGSPRLWKRPALLDDKAIEDFLAKKTKLDIRPVFFHASYLINLAALNQISQKSVDILIWELNLASRLGVSGSVVHLGSYLKHDPQLAYSKLIENMSLVLAQSPDSVDFIIENSAGKKIGQNLTEIFRIINDLKDKRLKICWDTCHGFASGINLDDKSKLDRFLSQIDDNVGLDRLVLWHFNDSKDAFNSHRDRHANIGQGYIGLDTFRTVINHPQANQRPMIIETPGFDGTGPDKKNLDILKGLIKPQAAKTKKNPASHQDCREARIN